VDSPFNHGLFGRHIDIVAGFTYIEFMCSPRSVLSALVTAGFLLCMSIGAAFGEDNPRADVQQDPRREWHELAKGQNEFEVSDAALLPTRLVLAVEQSGCRYKDEINSIPARLIRVESYRLAIVFCRSGIVGSHRVFDLTDLRRPRQMEFPILSHKNGFGTTSEPGMITWKQEAGVFEAEKRSDMLCTGEVRHTYRLGNEDMRPSFVIIRVGIKKDECKQDEWTTIWEGPTWSELTR